MKIKKASEKEIDNLCKIEMSSGYHKKKFNFKPLLENLINENANIFYSEENGKQTGYITLSKNGEIAFLSVSKDYQRKGIATRLLNKIISFSKNQNIKKLFLDVKKENKKAINLYLKFGFKIIKSYNKKINNKSIEKIKLEKQVT